MAKRNRNRVAPTAYHSLIANRLRLVRALSPLPRLALLSPVEDRRIYHPLRSVRPAMRVQGVPARVSRDGVKSGRLRPGYFFTMPKKVAICVRRKERREVLFAKGKTRSGAGGSKRRNYYSEVRC